MKRKRMKKNHKTKNIIFLMTIITIISIIAIQMQKKASLPIIHYEGKGMSKVIGKDGYTRVFTTKNQKEYKEYKQGGQASWANLPYWDNQMWDNGCGITTISIIASGYGKKVTPETLRKQYYPHLKGDNIPQAFRDLGIECTNFEFRQKCFTKEYITNWLKEDKPIMVCVTNQPNSKWTTSSHYLALLATDETKEYIYISNPNKEEHEKQGSNWYPVNDIIPYIVKAVFIK